MSVVGLPHNGAGIAIEVTGVVTIFGWQAYPGWVCPPARPDGEPWPHPREGREGHDETRITTILSMVEARHAAKLARTAGIGHKDDEWALHLSPENTAHMLAGEVIGMTSVMGYSSNGPTDNSETFIIASPALTFAITDGTAYKHGLRAIVVGQHFEGATLVAFGPTPAG